MVMNILYDDTQVLPEPRSRVQTVLLEGAEICALEALEVPLSAALDRLGNAGPVEYLDAPEWAEVVRLASIALAAMVRRGGCI